ncbi:hypothetical protein NEUTE1DRAFT_140303 [Neurospora tetrasperma FGSC 2508]|uniref:Uncharacterized protein n=1 Tax=Neurospora tetrasperma (strain FGSC 2508 / ATCC MYA-4615 / P0657) TaxID=510951 RepID=F8MVK0_NEUT8|nr:uncharacterized protein NEUTE1DRAFT_140303 [Neurospora tetrasperma FGSC 2508]EGO53952.1 hypothetical protein NEUTE1DRAFT_140303 [Neurospora tetrasperma FGSC 2508]EGZ68630.1 hypothetical protein NEUTE2DRAFT_170338 [Neurospora tetrasperma FGSC 2509]
MSSTRSSHASATHHADNHDFDPVLKDQDNDSLEEGETTLSLPEVSFLPRQATPEIKKSILPVPAVGISATSASPRLIQMMKTVRCLDDNALDC